MATCWSSDQSLPEEEAQMKNANCWSRCGSVAPSGIEFGSEGRWAGKQVSLTCLGLDLLFCKHFVEHLLSHLLVLFCGQRE